MPLGLGYFSPHRCPLLGAGWQFGPQVRSVLRILVLLNETELVIFPVLKITMVLVAGARPQNEPDGVRADWQFYYSRPRPFRGGAKALTPRDAFLASDPSW